jgi:glycerol kinase
MESILFLVQINLEEMSAEAMEVKQIMVSGGLSVLDGLCQRLADVTGLPVLRPMQSEATAKGLAFLLARTDPYVGDVEATWNTGNHKDHFTPATNSALLERYRRWRRALESELGEEVRGLGKENSEQAGNLIHE